LRPLFLQIFPNKDPPMASYRPIKALALASICLLQTMASDPAGAETVCPKRAFCDDFEDDRAGAPPGGPWTREIVGEPTIAVDRGEAFSGEQSVRIEAKGKETAFIALKGPPLFPMDGNALHGRGMIKLESAPDKRVHWTIIEGKGRSPEDGHVVEYRYGGAKPIEKDGVFQGSRLMANYETPDGPKTDCWRAARRYPTPSASSARVIGMQYGLCAIW
jgi:hypothetical protein